MIKTEIISANALKITAPEKLKADDFRQIAPQIDSLTSQYGKIRLLIDASGFNGWENIAAFENHAGFIKNHHQKIERIAVIATHDWQHWVIGAVRMFLHPEVRAYDKSHEAEALQWIVSTSAGVVAPTRHSKIASPAGASGPYALLDRQADDRTPSWKRRSTRMSGPSGLGDL